MKCTNFIYKDLDPNNYNQKSNSYSYSHKNTVIALPCGKCKACKYKKYSKWLERLTFEAVSTFEKKGCIYFVTLTYNNENYLKFDNQSLNVELQKLWKKIRTYNPKNKIKYFAVTETGSNTGRLHHHALIFSQNDIFSPNLKTTKKIKNGYYFQSDKFPWRNGYYSISKIVNKDEMIYVTQYVIKYLLKNPLTYSYSQKIGYDLIDKLSINDEQFIHNGFIKNKPNKRLYLDFESKINLNKILSVKANDLKPFYDIVVDNNPKIY